MEEIYRNYAASEGEESAIVPLASAAAQKALQIQPVLSAVARFLPPADLLLLRQTSTLWKSAFTPALKRSAHRPVFLSMPNSRIRFSMCMERFTQDMRMSSQIPFSRFEIHEATDADPVQAEILRDFLFVCGTGVRGLKIQFRGVDGSEDIVRDIVFNLTPNLMDLNVAFYEVSSHKMGVAKPVRQILPNLRSITIFCNSNSTPQPLVTFIVDILRSAVGLESLDLDQQMESISRLQILAAMRDDSMVLRLDKLKILRLYQPKEEELRILLQLARRNANAVLRLHNLRLHIEWNHQELQTEEYRAFSRVLNQFLELQALDMKKLEYTFLIRNNVEVSGQPQQFFVRLPRMERLEELDLELTLDAFWDAATPPVVMALDGSSSFQDNFPSLKRLTFFSDFWPALARISHSGLTELCLKEEVGQLELDLQGAWPSVRRLEVQVKYCRINLESLRSIWTKWPALNSLKLEIYAEDRERPLDLDEFLSGVEEPRFEQLARDLVDVGPLKVDTLRRLQALHKVNPSLSDLPNLLEFKLFAIGHFKLTDIGGCLGLALANPAHLQRMDIELVTRPGPLGCEAGLVQEFTSERCRSVVRGAFGPCALINYSSIN